MKNFRAPAYPLITIDPFFNVWSFSDKLYDDVPRHWTGNRQFMTGVVTIDKKVFKFMGSVYPDNRNVRTEPEIIEQVSVEVLPLTTKYVFENDLLTLEVNFVSPVIASDLSLMSRPISYVSYKAIAKDGKAHDFNIYFNVSFEMCVDTPDEMVTYSKTDYSICASAGKKKMLSRSGDDHRINWGTLHLIAPDHEMYAVSNTCGGHNSKDLPTYPEYVLKKNVLELGDMYIPSECWPALACEKSAVTDSFSGFIAIGYDDIKSIQYFGENIEAYWRKDGATFDEIAKLAIDDYDSIMKKVADFEADLLQKAGKISDKYAQICALAYRQAVAAHKLTYHDGEIQFLSKENYSNGCIGTVDVTYPSIPLFLIYNPVLVEGMLNPIFKLCDLGMWKYEFAPHDVGQYPLANMQVYGIGDKYTKRFVEKKEYLKGRTLEDCEMLKQMPIEECGNMLLCVAAVCAAKKDFEYAKLHHKILTQWANYLVKMGYDPENQLCTDDFAGHLAHNCNLSVKAIEALAAWANIEKALGNDDSAKHYRNAAEQFAALWTKNAYAGDHYKLAFDNDDSWSIKYNMVWDTLLDLNVFDKNIAKTEVDYYLKQANKFGIPLDNRSDYTKSDWQMWSTVLCDNKEYLECVVDKMYDMLEATRDRVPFTDWYYTSSPYMAGFQNRTVQAGLFINLLEL